jgi:predicted nucleic acid-binding protein
MSGSSLLLDTLLPLLEDRNLILSIITEIELLGYDGFSKNELAATKDFLDKCTIINLNTDIKNKAIAIRRKYKMKLPDSVIMATSKSLEIPLITADYDFKKVKSANIILYDSNL